MPNILRASAAIRDALDAMVIEVCTSCYLLFWFRSRFRGLSFFLHKKSTNRRDDDEATQRLSTNFTNELQHHLPQKTTITNHDQPPTQLPKPQRLNQPIMTMNPLLVNIGNTLSADPQRNARKENKPAMTKQAVSPDGDSNQKESTSTK